MVWKQGESIPEQIAYCANRLYEQGLNTSCGGNISVRDGQGNVWLTPKGGDKSMLPPESIMRVDRDGRIIGRRSLSSEAAIHRALLRERGRAGCVVHCHDVTLVGFSVMHKVPDTALFPTVMLGETPGFAPYATPGSADLAGRILEAFRQSGSRCVILENHGVFIVHDGLPEALGVLEAAKQLAAVQQRAAILGGIGRMPPDAAGILARCAGEPLPGYEPEALRAEEREAAGTLARLSRRAYRKRLFTCMGGWFAQRVGEDRFLMMADGADRFELGEGDFLLIDGGRCPRGARQPQYANFCRRIFGAYPEVNTIAFTQSPNAMAYAVTDVAFTSELLPESYALLRRVDKLPFGAPGLLNPGDLERFDPAGGPVKIIGNEGIVSLAKNPFMAFESVELMDEYAGILIDAKPVGRTYLLSAERLGEFMRMAMGGGGA